LFARAARVLRLPAQSTETYTAHGTAIPAVKFNKVYLTPCSTVPSSTIAAASDKRCSLGRMRHASALTLQSLEPLLTAVRSIPSLVERRPGTFYFRSAAFLHFHEDPAGLFADVKLDLLTFERLPANAEEEHEALLRSVRGALSGAVIPKPRA